MQNLSKRQLEILNIIYTHNDYVISSSIVNKLKITRRTLINDIKVINNEHELILSSNKGYLINKKYNEYINDILSNNYNNEENIDSIIKYIMVNQGKSSISNITNDFYISSSKLIKLLPSIDETLKKYNLQLKRKNNNLDIIGEEKDKRRMMAHIIHNESYSFFSDIENFKDYFPNLAIEEICPAIIEIINKHGYSIPKYYEMNFYINILMILSRNPFIISNSFEKSPSTTRNYDSRVIAYEINEMLEDKFHMHYINKLITIKEIEQTLDSFLAGDQLDPTSYDLSKSFVAIVRDIVEETFKYYYLSAIDYQSFLNVFCLHVSEMIKRCMHTINYVPSNTSLKQSEPYVYEIAVSIANKLSKAFDIKIPDSEINLISIHIGYAIEQAVEKASIAPIVIVSQFPKTSSLIADKLVKNVGYKVQIMGFYNSLFEIPLRFYKKCLIITSETNKTNHSNICTISPLVSDSDINKVQKTILGFIKERNNLEVSELIHKYLSEDSFFVLDKPMDKKEAINFLCTKAYENKDVNQDYYNQVIHREKLSSTMFFDKFAIPHSCIQNANNTRLYLLINKKAISWSKAKINLVCLITIKRELSDDFRKLYSGLSEILYNNDSLFDDLDKIEKLDDFLEYLLK